MNKEAHAVIELQTNAFWKCPADYQTKRDIIDRMRNQIEARRPAKPEKPDILGNIMPYLILFAQENA